MSYVMRGMKHAHEQIVHFTRADMNRYSRDASPRAQIQQLRVQANHHLK